jgi:hypothetical protein
MAVVPCSRYVDTRFSDEYAASIFKVKFNTVRTQSDVFISDSLNIILEKQFLVTKINKVYRIILGPVYDNQKEIWRIISNKEIDATVKKPNITETVRLYRLCWFGHG